MLAYLCCEYDDGSVTSRLIASKSKVAPLTPMTISRLELMRVILGWRLTQSVIKVLDMTIKNAVLMCYGGFMEKGEISIHSLLIASKKYR